MGRRGRSGGMSHQVASEVGAYGERDAVAVVVDAAGTDRQDLALLGLLLGGVRDDETGRGGLLGLDGLDDDAVFERLDGNRHGGPPLRDSRDRTGGGATSGAAAGHAAVAGIDRARVRLALARGECQPESRSPVSTRSTRVPERGAAPGRKDAPWISPTPRGASSPARAGACCSRSRRTTRTPRWARLRLRAAGFDADLVAAALTQSRLRARAVDKFGDFADGMLFTPDGLEQATRLAVAARHAAALPRAGVRQVPTSAAASAPTRWPSPADLQVRPSTPTRLPRAIAGVNLRHWPGRTHHGRARRGPAAAHRRGGPAHRLLARPGPPLTGRGRRPGPDQAGLLPRGDLAVVAGAALRPRAAGDRRQAQPVLPARRVPRRRRGPVDVVRR